MRCRGLHSCIQRLRLTETRARKGARRLKVGFETDAARNLYLGAGLVQTSIDRLLIRAVH